MRSTERPQETPLTALGESLGTILANGVNGLAGFHENFVEA